MSTTLRICHGNGHNEPSLVKFAKNADFDSASFNEADRQKRGLARVKGTRMDTAGPGFRDRRADSTIMLTADRWPSLGRGSRLISERIPTAIRVAPDRVALYTAYRHPVATAIGAEGVFHLGAHLVAGPRKLNDPRAGDSPIVEEYEDGIGSCEHLLEWARAEGLVRVLTGDLQVRRGNKLPWSPTRLAQRQDMVVHTQGIDWLLHDVDLHLKRVDTRDLFDHVGFVATLVPAQIKEHRS